MMLSVQIIRLAKTDKYIEFVDLILFQKKIQIQLIRTLFIKNI